MLGGLAWASANKWWTFRLVFLGRLNGFNCRLFAGGAKLYWILEPYVGSISYPISVERVDLGWCVRARG